MAKNLIHKMLSTSSTASSSKTLTTAAATSTAIATATSTASSAIIKDKKNALYPRLSQLGDHEIDLTVTLDEYVKEGHTLKKFELMGFVTEFRKYKRYRHALQILDWMVEKKVTKNLTAAEQAIRLALISKTEGIESVEKAFANLPENAKQHKATYGALLHSYCTEGMKEKAMEVVKKMKELGIPITNLAYNNLMSMHMKLGEPEKVPLLLQEMKEKEIIPDFHSYIFVMNSYAALKDMEGVDRVVEEMKVAEVKCDWMAYTNLACIYIKAGLFQKANSALEKIERMEGLRDRKAYNMLITLYGQTSNRDGVERVWKFVQSTFSETTNLSYLAMVEALWRLGDTDELIKCFEEWKSSFKVYDMRLANIVIDSYLSRDMLAEANIVYEDAMKRGSRPNLKTCLTYMNFYLKKRQMDLALKNFEGACSRAEEKAWTKWKPSEETINTFLKHYEIEKDVVCAERLYKGLKTVECLSSEVYCSLLQTYVAAGLTEPHMRQRIEEDGIKKSAVMETLLETVCPN